MSDWTKAWKQDSISSGGMKARALRHLKANINMDSSLSEYTLPSPPHGFSTAKSNKYIHISKQSDDRQCFKFRKIVQEKLCIGTSGVYKNIIAIMQYFNNVEYYWLFAIIASLLQKNAIMQISVYNVRYA